MPNFDIYSSLCVMRLIFGLFISVLSRAQKTPARGN